MLFYGKCIPLLLQISRKAQASTMLHPSAFAKTEKTAFPMTGDLPTVGLSLFSSHTFTVPAL